MFWLAAGIGCPSFAGLVAGCVPGPVLGPDIRLIRRGSVACGRQGQRVPAAGRNVGGDLVTHVTGDPVNFRRCIPVRRQARCRSGGVLSTWVGFRRPFRLDALAVSSRIRVVSLGMMSPAGHRSGVGGSRAGCLDCARLCRWTPRRTASAAGFVRAQGPVWHVLGPETTGIHSGVGAVLLSFTVWQVLRMGEVRRSCASFIPKTGGRVALTGVSGCRLHGLEGRRGCRSVFAWGCFFFISYCPHVRVAQSPQAFAGFSTT